MSRHLDSSTTTQMAKIMVQHGRPSRSSWKEFVRESFGRTVVGKAIWENPIAARLGKGFLIGNAYSYTVKKDYSSLHREKGLFSSVYVDDIKLAGKKQNIDPLWKVLNKEVDLGEPTSFLDHVYLGCTQRQCEISKDIVDNYRTMFKSRISAARTEKLPCSENLSISSWSYDMEGHAKKCVERYCELSNKTTQQLYKVPTPCIYDHYLKEEELKSVGELSQVSSQIVLKCLYLARIGRPDILWSVNKLAQSITKWTKACDKRLSRLISYIHHTCDIKQYCHVGNTAKQCRLGLFKTPILQEILRTQNLLRVEHCAILEVIYLFQSVGCVRSKLQFRTVQQNPRSSLWTRDWDWMVCLLWNYGIQLFLSLEIVLVFQIERGNLWMVKTNTTSLTIKSMQWKTLILFLQMSNCRASENWRLDEFCPNFFTPLARFPRSIVTLVGKRSSRTPFFNMATALLWSFSLDLLVGCSSTWRCAKVILARPSRHSTAGTFTSGTSGPRWFSLILPHERILRRIWWWTLTTLIHIVAETAIVSFHTLPVGYPLPTISKNSLYSLFLSPDSWQRRSSQNFHFWPQNSYFEFLARYFSSP